MILSTHFCPGMPITFPASGYLAPTLVPGVEGRLWLNLLRRSLRRLRRSFVTLLVFPVPYPGVCLPLRWLVCWHSCSRGWEPCILFRKECLHGLA
jgi:hypothetical protein